MLRLFHAWLKLYEWLVFFSHQFALRPNYLKNNVCVFHVQNQITNIMTRRSSKCGTNGHNLVSARASSWHLCRAERDRRSRGCAIRWHWFYSHANLTGSAAACFQLHHECFSLHGRHHCRNLSAVGARLLWTGRDELHCPPPWGNGSSAAGAALSHCAVVQLHVGTVRLPSGLCCPLNSPLPSWWSGGD